MSTLFKMIKKVATDAADNHLYSGIKNILLGAKNKLNAIVSDLKDSELYNRLQDLSHDIDQAIDQLKRDVGNSMREINREINNLIR